MTGGAVNNQTNTIILDTVEALNADGTSLCNMPKLTNEKFGRTLDRNLLCGGNIDPSTCLQYDEGNWNQLSFALNQPREMHVSWKRPNDKVILMGGLYSPNTTEIVSPYGSQVVEDFLAHNTR